MTGRRGLCGPSAAGDGLDPVPGCRASLHSPARGEPKPAFGPGRLLWVAAGFAAAALGLVGAVLPLLPTTPLMILAAFCFARGSERLHRRLVDDPRFGPAIRDWNRHGAISPGGKRLATAAMALALAVTAATGLPLTVIALQAVAIAGAAIFVLTRPSPPA